MSTAPKTTQDFQKALAAESSLRSCTYCTTFSAVTGPEILVTATPSQDVDADERDIVLSEALMSLKKHGFTDDALVVRFSHDSALVNGLSFFIKNPVAI